MTQTWLQKRCVKRRWETKWDGLNLTTEKIRKGRSPETGVEVSFEGLR